jgi:hypothetical protein
MKISTIDRPNDGTFSDASRLLNSPDDSLTSIKIRPINHFPLSDQDEYWDAYVYPSEYEQIDLSLVDNVIREGRVNYGEAKCFEVDNSKYIFAKHESGPEIIANLALITSSLTLVVSIINLVTAVIKTINDSNNKKKDGKESGRYHEAVAISVETRTKKNAKVVKIYKLPLNDSDLTQEEIKKLLNKM